MNRGRLSKFICVVITGVIAISGLPSLVLADMLNAPSFYSVQSNLDYEIATNITSSWINHENVDLVLVNTGSETIHNWYITFNTPYNIDNIWNGALYETDGNGTYTITSNGWNQDIHTGESVTVGITFSSDTEEELSVDPEWYLLNTQATVVDASQYTLEYTEYSAWETGFTGQLTLTPQIDCQHWELSFGSNREITAVSSAVLISEGENNYAITHDENNMRLFAGTAYNFGIQGVKTEDPLNLSNVELTVVDLAYHLTDDVDANGVPDYLDYIGGGRIISPASTPTPVPTDVPTEAPTIEPTGTETPTPTEEPTPTSVEDPYLDLEDSDGDGLLDYQEFMYMTDPDNPDTDGDGLLDGDEINIGTSPNLPDTDGNGLIDFDEDCDGDGICNGGEYATGTCMFAYDSDYDGINDYNEIYFYGIDPRNEDSDLDGIKDGDEVTLGLNPRSNDSDGDGITDDYVTFNQTLSMDPIAEDHPHEITGVSISGNISGLITSNTSIEDTFNRDIYCTAVYGRIGVPISIESEGHFDSMTLTIYYDESALEDANEADLGVLWYDEETGFFIVQEQTVVDTNSNSVTLELTHFSTYILVDLNKWNNLPITPTTSIEGSIRTITWRTNGVYYADPVIETNSQGQLVLTGWANQTASPERYESTAWNKYLESHPNDVRVETVNMRYIRDSWGGLYYVYTWNICTTEVVNVDNDQDGVQDYYETQGVWGMNGQVYYSDPTDIDSDDDTIIDGDELGIVYTLQKHNDGHITILLNVVPIYESDEGVVDQESEYYYMNKFFVNMESGQSLCVASVISDPILSDTDEDGCRDDEDARPKVKNPTINYIVSNPDFSDCANRRRELYRINDIPVILIVIEDKTTFVDAWNEIGFSLWGTKTYGSKYYYSVDNVVICTHGCPEFLMLNDSKSDIKYRLYSNDCIENASIPEMNIVTPYDLVNKNMNSLNIYACSAGGECSLGDNVARSLLRYIDGADQVIAPDVTLCGHNDHYFFRSYNDYEICSEDEFIRLRYTASLGVYQGTHSYCSPYNRFNNSQGFLVYNRMSDAPYDLYSDDVFVGLLKITQTNYDSNGGGIIYYDNSIYDQVEENWHDPVLG